MGVGVEPTPLYSLKISLLLYDMLKHNSHHQISPFAQGVNDRPSVWGCAQPARHTVISKLPRPSTMDTNSKRQKRRDNVLSLLNVAIEATNLAKEASNGTPAQAIFGPINIILTMVKVRFSSFRHSTLGSHVSRTI